MFNLTIIPLFSEILLALTGLGLLMLGAIKGRDAGGLAIGVAVGMAILALFFLGSWPTFLSGMIIGDSFAIFLKILILLGVATVLIVSKDFCTREGILHPEYAALVLFAAIGMMLMVSAHNFLALYMAMELQALSLYILVAFNRESKAGAEAGVKYFLLGVMASALMLFGMSFLYGFSGTLDYDMLREALSMGNFPPPAALGLVLMLAAMAFKISAAPFHMWTPDVYQGAPTCVTAFLGIVPKVAAMGVLVRLALDPFAGLTPHWMGIITVLAIVSMGWGAIAGVIQQDIKRLMAYSAIGHMGYALLGLIAGETEGIGAILVYLAIYTLMTAGVFAIIVQMRSSRIQDLAGASVHRPFLAATLAILMFSMAGIPPLAGFFGKLLVFWAIVDKGMYALAIYGILTSVVAAAYYLRVVKVLYFDTSKENADTCTFDSTKSALRALVLMVACIFVGGFAFSFAPVMIVATKAAACLF